MSSAGPRSALRSARVRTTEDRFELSTWDGGFALVVGMALSAGLWMLSVWVGATLGIASMAIGAFAIATARQRLVVTRDDARAEWTVLGICWKRARLGRRPSVETGLGWSWSELAVLPSDERLRKGLHDDERFVLAQWDDEDTARRSAGAELAALARREIDRLHGDVAP